MQFDKPRKTRRKKIAIVGFSESSRHLAPYDDDTWEIHAMNQLYRHIPRATHWWEMHKREDFLADQVPGTDYLQWLKDCPIPIHMVSKFEDIPNSVEYPIEEFANKYGDYFYSTISYMLAWAINEGYEEIGIYGIDLSHDSEYEYQKPSAEYFLGIARGLGIQLRIASQSALLRGMYRYGYQTMPSNEDLEWLQVYERRVAASRDEHLGAVNQMQGQLNAAAEFKSWVRAKRRGSAPPDVNAPDPI